MRPNRRDYVSLGARPLQVLFWADSGRKLAPLLSSYTVLRLGEMNLRASTNFGARWGLGGLGQAI